MPSISSIRRGAGRSSRGATAAFLIFWGTSVFLAPDVGAQEAPLGPGTPAMVQGMAEGALLRDAPGYEAGVLAPLAAGTGVEIVAGPVAAADGSSWLQVGAGGVVGFVPAGLLAPIAAVPVAEGVEAPPAAEAIPAADAAPVPATADVVAAQPVPAGEAVTTSDVNLRGGPDMMAPVLAVLPPGSPLTVTGEASGGFAPVNAGGVVGWVATEFVGAPGAAPAPEQAPAETAAAAPVPPASTGGTAATTDLVNLRSGPSYEADVLSVIPPGTTVTASGSLENGFFPVQYGGQGGWVASEFLTFQGDEAAPADAALAPPPAEAPALEAPEEPSLAAPVGSGIAWPFSGGTWQVIQGYNNGTHTNRSSFANYQYSLDLARVDGETAGQTVLAPASGTVSWVDGGSGGILIDMGNGYGVAMFHITVDPSIGSGDAVTQGQPVGTVSGPGGPGYASTPHIDLTLWGLSGGGGHVSTPFSGQFAISGREFPDTGGANQHMEAEVSA